MITRATVIIRTERQIQSSGRNSIFGVFVNPTMRKVAPLIKKVAGRQRDAQTIEILGAYTLLR